SLNESEESDNSKEECTSESESEETDDSESEGNADTGEFDHRWEELREDAPDTDEITRRLAVCNMDWDRIRAEDLFAVFDSFKPADGLINSVKIYPSEYGMKRMEEEKLHGPPELVEEILDPDEEEVEDKKTSKYHREKLRQYQINRLKYYYAVIDCDSPNTANNLYEQLNGMEYESSSVRFDIRFIPDDVTFDYEPTSVADKIPDPIEYKPRLFVTTALQQVKVNLTWDETDPKRRETLQKAFTEPDSIERDIKDYLASSSSESEVEINGDGEEEGSENNKISTKKRIAKYKALLQSLEEKEKQDEDKYEMEITWEPGLKERTEEIVKEKIEKVSLNPFEEMRKKKKEQRKLRKKEKKMSNYEISDKDYSASEESGEEFFSKKKPVEKKMEERDVKQLAELSLLSDSRRKDIIENVSKKKKEKKKSKLCESEDFKCDVNDPRFSAIYTSHLFNIDPSDPHFKKTEGNLALIQEKQKKLKHKDSYNDSQRNVKKAKYF
ncbi:ESF1 homolog, partial [Stegodyphus dumicola]|uniref:ESF1 homolog n=1 Tax=Stegodyphus dumicola TaxID=202533 RepID=UPI0015AD638C